MVKTALFSGRDIVIKKNLAGLEKDLINRIKTGYPRVQNVILCSVKPDDPLLVDMLRQCFGYVLILDENTPVPVKNMYQTPGTLGKDRLAGVVGANNIYPDRNVLIIDAGTAITYDVVDDQNRYIGGNISPGLTMRFRALHDFTGRLPLVEPKTEVPFLAGNTEDAIAGGVQNGIVFEMDSCITLFKKKFKDLIIIFTGGDAEFFDKKLKSTIFVDPDLILRGLNRILIYNVENK